MENRFVSFSQTTVKLTSAKSLKNRTERGKHKVFPIWRCSVSFSKMSSILLFARNVVHLHCRGAVSLGSKDFDKIQVFATVDLFIRKLP